MATKQDIERDRELLKGLGLPEVRIWPPRCDWYTKDGEVRPNLSCDPYSRGLWLERGMRPDIWSEDPKPSQQSHYELPLPANVTPTLVEALIGLGSWVGTVTELFFALEKVTDDIPMSASRLSREIGKVENELKVRNVTVHRVRDKHQRLIRFSPNSL